MVQVMERLGCTSVARSELSNALIDLQQEHLIALAGLEYAQVRVCAFA